MVQGISQPQFVGEGFLVDQAGVQQHIEAIPRNGMVVPTYIYETTLTPIQSGKLTLFAQGFTSGNRFSGPIVIQGGSMTIPGGPPQYLLLESDPLELEVRPLPREGELPGFTGGIGVFTNDPPRLSTNLVRVGNPVKLSVTFRGEGNLMRLVAPTPQASPDWQIFNSTSAAIPPQVIQAQGFVNFEYTLVPRTETPRATPAIPFATYDPKRAEYVNLTIPPVPIMIAPGDSPADVAILHQADAIAEPAEPEPALSGLAGVTGLTAPSLRPVQEQAWFPVLQLCPGFAFLGLWAWDRRRRYLELHPEIVLRRRARRALRRERRKLGHAAREGDAPRFADSAVTAMRVACAPHYPAEQRALVGGDVLQVLGDKNGASGVVRKFFAVTDAATYAAAPSDTKELLALEPELHQILEQLDARLVV
jgi:hypothetical protein